jgi:hypothetical protein
LPVEVTWIISTAILWPEAIHMSHVTARNVWGMWKWKQDWWTATLECYNILEIYSAISIVIWQQQNSFGSHFPETW